MLFGRPKKEEAKTVLIVDIEGGSVAAALARRAADGSLAILNERRLTMPLRPHRSAEALASEAQKLLERLLPEMSALALRFGGASSVDVFLSPPWGKPNLESGTPDFVPHMQESVRRHLSPYFAHTPQFHTSAGAALGGLRAAVPAESDYLLCIVTGEMTELLHLHDGAVVGRASMPHGVNLPLRTLHSHAGMSGAEARSALKLGHPAEPLAAATESYAHELFATGRDLFDTRAPKRVWVVSSLGDYFARALSHHTLNDLFHQGGVVSALRPGHAAHLIPGASGRDLFLILETLFLLYS
jgi:hypothetical protein